MRARTTNSEKCVLKHLVMFFFIYKTPEHKKAVQCSMHVINVHETTAGVAFYVHMLYTCTSVLKAQFLFFILSLFEKVKLLTNINNVYVYICHFDK